MEAVVERICRIPLDSEHGDVSAYELVTRSGVRECMESLVRDDVSAYLRRNSFLIERWLTLSADQRIPSGWFFAEEDRKYLVQYYPDGQRLTFDEATEACADFICRWVRSEKVG